MGGVSGNTIKDTRTMPAADYEYPFMYCVEAHETTIDRRAVASSPSMMLTAPDGAGTSTTFSAIQSALKNPIIFDGPQSLDSDGNFSGPPTVPNECGRYIEAIYRPLSTIYNGPAASKTTGSFDYLDPQFYPCSRVFPANGWPGEQNDFCMKDLVTGLPVEIPNGAGQAILVTETWQEFTIRRVMCPSVPWATIQQLTNRINGLSAWKPANMTIPGLAYPDPNNAGNLITNTFPIGTLRFDTAEPIKRIIPMWPDPLGGANNPTTTTWAQWWDITYKFSWRTTWAVWTSYDQTVQNPCFIPWNCDWFMGVPMGMFANLAHAIFAANNTSKGLPGWYEMTFQQPTNPLFSTATRRKYLDAEDPSLPINANGLVNGATHPFDTLFMLNAP